MNALRVFSMISNKIYNYILLYAYIIVLQVVFLEKCYLESHYFKEHRHLINQNVFYNIFQHQVNRILPVLDHTMDPVYQNEHHLGMFVYSLNKYRINYVYHYLIIVRKSHWTVSYQTLVKTLLIYFVVSFILILINELQQKMDFVMRMLLRT